MKSNCRVLTKEEVKLIGEVRELKTDVAWIKKLLLLILGLVLANLAAVIIGAKP
jgi:hypothetical protein